jgi:putative transposase
MRFVSYQDRKPVAAAMREIYTAPTVDAAQLALNAFDATFGERYPGAVDDPDQWVSTVPKSI